MRKIKKIPLCFGLKSTLIDQPYSFFRFKKDLLSAFSLALVSLPLAMALAVASGAPPQHGLYTAIIGSLIVAILGGSPMSVTGPTAAFVAVLYPIALTYGLYGLWIAGLLAGLLIIIMAAVRMDQLIQFIPSVVRLGFISGMGLLIIHLQLKDFLGLKKDFEFSFNLQAFTSAIHKPDFLVGLLSLLILSLWPTKVFKIPALIPAIFVGIFLAYYLPNFDMQLDTLAFRFTYNLGNSTGVGIPPFLPYLIWPFAEQDTVNLKVLWNNIEPLLMAAASVAVLASIESLMCAKSMTQLSGKKHNAQNELYAQGIANIVLPFFGGIPAAAAITRSIVLWKSDAETPIATILHAFILAISIWFAADFLSHIPMSTLAAILMMVAFNMIDVRKIIHVLRDMPRADILIFLTSVLLTISFNMVVAITFGVIAASLSFVREVSRMTKISNISQNKKHITVELPDRWDVYKISGSLFFAAADRIFNELEEILPQHRGLILYMDAVPVLDSGGYNALQNFITKCLEHNTVLIIADLQFQPLKVIAKAKMPPIPYKLKFASTLEQAIQDALHWEYE